MTIILVIDYYFTFIFIVNVDQSLLTKMFYHVFFLHQNKLLQ